MKMEEGLCELLDLSIASPDGGISYVNFKAMRKLLQGILQLLGIDRENADGRTSRAGRDAEKSRKDEKSAEQPSSGPGQPLSETELPSLSTSDTTREEEMSKFTSLIQGLLKKNQELKEVTKHLEEEMETIKNLFSQVHDMEPLVISPISGLGGEHDMSEEAASQSRDGVSGSEQQHDPQIADLRNVVQQLYKAVQNIKQEMLALRMEQRGSAAKKMQDKELKDHVTGTDLSDTSAKITFPPTSRDSSTSASDEVPSQISSRVEQCTETPAAPVDLHQLQELHKSLKARVEHLEGEREQILKQVNQLTAQLVKTIMADINKVYEMEPLAISPETSGLNEEHDKSAVTAIQSKDSISGSEQQHLQTAGHGLAVKQLHKEVQNIKQELQTLKIEHKRTSKMELQDRDLKDRITGTKLSDTSAKIKIPPTSKDTSTAASEEASSQISSGVKEYTETPAAPLDLGHLQEMHKCLSARLEHLEGEKESIQDQVNELKTQLEEIVMVDTKKMYEMEALIMGPESSGLDGELGMSVDTGLQSTDSSSGSEQQQHDPQIADLRNAVQQLYKAVQNMKQELQALRIEQKRTVKKEIQAKELKDSITGTGVSDTSAKIKVPPTSSDSSTAISDEVPSQISSDVEQCTETIEAPMDVDHLHEMHKGLSARMEHMEGERKHILEQVNQLKTQLELAMSDTKKVYDTKPLVTDQESSGLSADVDESEMTTIQSIISGSVQEHDLETAELRNAMQKLYKEVQKVKQELQALRMQQTRTSGKEMQFGTTELTSDVQGVNLKLQAEFEKLQSTTTDTMREGMSMQEQTQFEHLYKAIKELDEKADEEMKMTKGMKFEMDTLETTVSATTEQLKGMFQDLLSSSADLEENYHTVTEKIFRELKLNHNEIDHLQKQIVTLQKTQRSESDHAAIVKKQLLTRFHCLSCDRPVNLKTPGPYIPVVPGMPGFPLRHHRKMTPSFNFGPSERAPTEMSMKHTREQDSYDFNAQVYQDYQDNIDDVKSLETRLTSVPPKEGESSIKKEKQWIPEEPQNLQQAPSVPSAKENLSVPLKEGYCEYNANHSQLPPSIIRKFRQPSPFRQQQSETELICIGTSCFKKEKQWVPEDSLPQT